MFSKSILWRLLLLGNLYEEFFLMVFNKKYKFELYRGLNYVFNWISLLKF